MLMGDARVAEYIKNTSWDETLPDDVKKQVVKCAIDLFGAVIAGTMTLTSDIMCKIACRYYPGTDASIILKGRKASLPGVAMANGFTVNALDVDDGHRLVKGHPGAVVFPAVLAAGEFKDITIKEFLTALVIGYEVAIRSGLALHSHYNFYHGSGSWGALGAAAGVSRIMGLDAKKAVHALGIAEYHAPLTPVMRPVAYPSMNKDGIGWGTMTGMMAVLMADEGFTGKPSLLDLSQFGYLTQNLGNEHEIMNIYFKPYTCCRWAHPAISAVIHLRNKYSLTPDMIKKIDISTFAAAASLSEKMPENTEEAQYSLLYPVAAALIEGEFGPGQVLGELFGVPDIKVLMNKSVIRIDKRFDSEFPAKRLCEVLITTKDDKVFSSGVFSSAGEPDDPVGLDWIIAKFKWLVKDVIDSKRADDIIKILTGSDQECKLREVIQLMSV